MNCAPCRWNAAWSNTPRVPAWFKFGDTHVLVTATLEERLPPWLKGQGRGWVTAEYGMLPRATWSAPAVRLRLVNKMAAPSKSSA